MFNDLFKAASKKSAHASGAAREDVDCNPYGLSGNQLSAYNLPLNKSCVVKASAGSGKTKLLVLRILKLLKNGVFPSAIVAVTFTRKACEEIQQRVSKEYGGQIKIYTLHALAYKTLGKEGACQELAPDNIILDIINKHKHLLPDFIQDFSVEEIRGICDKMRQEDAIDPLFENFLLAYQLSLSELDLMDFTGLLEKALPFARPEFRFLLVDEAQDLTKLQIEFLNKIIEPNAARWYVGDENQIIYSFCGANENVFNGLTKSVDDVVLMRENFRCGKSIVHAANNLLSKNEPIDLIAKSVIEGSVSIHNFKTGEEELYSVLDWAREKPGRVVLARTQKQIKFFKRYNEVLSMSVHEAKGLEFNEVWLIGCEDGTFPHSWAKLEEERKLFYVAMTRAKIHLHLSYANTRGTKGRKFHKTASCFLFDMKIS